MTQDDIELIRENLEAIVGCAASNDCSSISLYAQAALEILHAPPFPATSTPITGRQYERTPDDWGLVIGMMHHGTVVMLRRETGVVNLIARPWFDRAYRLAVRS